MSRRAAPAAPSGLQLCHALLGTRSRGPRITRNRWASSESGATSVHKVGWCGARAFQGFVHHHVHEHVPGPAVLQGGGGVPGALVRGFGLVQQYGDVAPGQLCNRLLHNWIRPSGGESAHVLGTLGCILALGLVGYARGKKVRDAVADSGDAAPDAGSKDAGVLLP